MGQQTSTPQTAGTHSQNNRNNVNNGNGSSSADSRANDSRRVTFGGPAADVIRPKPPRQQTTAGMSTRQSWPNISQAAAETIPTGAGDIAGPSSRPPNHLFHTNHGKNIVLSPNRKLATRSGSFCNAIVFTYRPLRLQDPLHLQLIQSTQGWSGVIRFGFTCHCPDRMKPNTMPKYACPDLTVKQGYWVKALRETLAANGNILSFFVNSRGEVFYSINGEPFHMFFNGVDVGKPLWALIDVYGNTTGIRIIDDYSVSNNVLNMPPTTGFPHGDPSARGPTTSASTHSLPPTINAATPEGGNPRPFTSIRPQLPLPPLPPLPSQAHSQRPFERLPFHSVHGTNITFSEGLMSAERKSDVCSGGLVFICRALKVNEAVFICIKSVNHRYIGHLGIGLTTCDPKALKDVPIPDDAEHVYDRPEYWVLTREFDQPAVNDILGIAFNADGEVHLLNPDGSSKSCLMFVDTTMPLWLYFDIYGVTQAIQTLGYREIVIPSTGISDPTADSNASNLNAATAGELEGASMEASLISSIAALNLSELLMPPQQPSSSAAAQSSSSSSSLCLETLLPPKQKPPRPSKPPTKKNVPPEDEECAICFESRVDTVFYKCGHTCCCFECANRIRGQACPICRDLIVDVIKMFKP